jgi:hypothetical protein
MDFDTMESQPLRALEQRMPLYLRILIWFGLISVQAEDSAEI